MKRIYHLLSECFPSEGWWPAESPLEIAVGAVLTQNTSWNGAAKAIANLKSDGPLTLQRLLELDEARMAELIRPASYRFLKTRRLRNLLHFIRDEYGSLESMRSAPLETLRTGLLGVNGVGPETADSILLYALGKPSFVVDAYTRRVLARHGILSETATYDAVKALFESSLPRSVRIYGHFHACLVEVCKTYCLKRRPKCDSCPLTGVPRR